jgi:hypothetical protein
MKLGKTVLLEIVSIVQDALTGGRDASEALREIEVDISDKEWTEDGPSESAVVELADSYVKSHPRAGEWDA